MYLRVDQYQNELRVASLKLLLFVVSTGLFVGCGNPGFSNNGQNPTDGSGTSPPSVLPESPTAIKSTGIEVVTGAAVNIVGSNGSKASISIGDVSKNKTKTANGYHVFLNVSGQNFSQ